MPLDLNYLHCLMMALVTVAVPPLMVAAGFVVVAVVMTVMPMVADVLFHLMNHVVNFLLSMVLYSDFLGQPNQLIVMIYLLNLTVQFPVTWIVSKMFLESMEDPTKNPFKFK